MVWRSRANGRDDRQKKNNMKTYTLTGKHSTKFTDGAVRTIVRCLSTQQAADRAACEAVTQGWHDVTIEAFCCGDEKTDYDAVTGDGRR